jgi:hypothetical protein
MTRKLSKREQRIREEIYHAKEEHKKKREEGGLLRMLNFFHLSKERWDELTEEQQMAHKQFYWLYQTLQQIVRLVYPPKPTKKRRLQEYLANPEKMDPEARMCLRQIEDHTRALKHIHKVDSLTFCVEMEKRFVKAAGEKKITKSIAEVCLDYSMRLYDRV